MNKNISLHLVTATALAALVLSFGRLVDFTPDASPQAPATVAAESTAPAEIETTSTAKPVTSSHRGPSGRPFNV
ncbi:MAG TPA: hypothetical protein VGD88_02255 [Opitutaceae bacterium]